METSKSLRVGAESFPPFVNPCVFRPEREKQCRLTGGGSNYDLFTIVARMAGYSELEWIQMPETKIRNFSRPHTWTGPLGMLTRGEIDVTGQLLFVEKEFEPFVADFSLPVLSITRGLVMKRPTMYDRDILSQTVINPFSYSVWMALMGMSVVILLFQLLHSLPFLRPFNFSSKRIFEVCLAVEVFFVFRGYKGKFYGTRVSTVSPELPFHDFQDFAEKFAVGEAHYVTNTYNSVSLKNMNMSRETVDLLVTENYHHNPIRLYSSLHEVFKAIREDRTLVTVVAETTFKFFETKHCNQLAYVPTSSIFRMLSFAFRKDSGLVDEFNRALYSSAFSPREGLEMIHRRYHQELLACEFHKTFERQQNGRKNSRLRPMTYTEIRTAILYYLIIFVLGPVTGFLSEIIFFQLRKRRLQSLFHKAGMGQLLSMGTHFMGEDQGNIGTAQSFLPESDNSPPPPSTNGNATRPLSHADTAFLY